MNWKEAADNESFVNWKISVVKNLYHLEDFYFVCAKKNLLLVISHPTILLLYYYFVFLIRPIYILTYGRNENINFG